MDHYLNLVSNKTKESVKSIFLNSNETNFLLKLLRIQALLEYSISDLKTTNGLKISSLTSKEQYKIVEKLELIKSNDYEGIIDNILIEHFQSNIQSLSSSNISRYMLEKILFFCYALSSLEIPIEEELLAKLWSFQQADLRKILILLDKNGIFNTSFETDYTLPHPEYSSRLIEAIENSHSLLSEFTTEFINDISNDKTLHFIDV